jgi:hypothetical protein
MARTGVARTTIDLNTAIRVTAAAGPLLAPHRIER